MFSLFTALRIVLWGLLGQVQLLCMMFSFEMLKVPPVFESLNTGIQGFKSKEQHCLHKMEPLAALPRGNLIRNIGNAPEHEFNYGEFNKLLNF